MQSASHYQAANPDALGRRLTTVEVELVATHRDLAASLIAAHDGYWQGLSNSRATSITAVKVDAEMAEAPFKVDVLKLRGEIAALEAERLLLLRLLA